MEFYLKEAFQSLKLLEDDFNLTADQGVIDELQSFVADDIEAPAEEEIIDVEADEVEDLQDNYIGKVILECDCCHTRIYKDIKDVVIDDDSGLANIEEQCPVCSNAFGWNVIGKIEPFKEDEFDEKPEEVEDAEVVPEISDDEIGEALKEALNERLDPEEQKELDGIVYNHLADAAYEAEVEHELDAHRSDMEKAEDNFNKDFYRDDIEEGKKLTEGVEEVKNLVYEYLYDKIDEINDNLAYVLHDAIPDYDVEWCIEDGLHDLVGKSEDAEDNYISALIDVLFANAPKGESLEEAKDCDDSVEEDCDKEDLEEEFENPDKVGLDPDTSVEDDQKLEEPFENPITEDPKVALAEELKEDVEEVQSEDAEKLVDPEQEPVLDESLNEDLSEVEVHTDDGSVSVEKEGPKVIVDFGAEEDQIEAPEDEMIAPLDAEEINFIDNNEEQSAEDAAVEDDFDSMPDDEFAIDDFDEESFDEIGESYLHRVYDNVDSFKTNRAIFNEGKLIVEGVITFKSGKTKKSSFVFEGFKTTKRGKTLAEGMNDTFSKSKRAFILKGTLTNKNFVSESLTYNYTVKSLNESNESEVTRVYGRAIRK